MVDHAVNTLELKCVVATTTYDNVASMGVMRKLRMRIGKNLLSEPAWLQVVGILENTRTLVRIAATNEALASL